MRGPDRPTRRSAASVPGPGSRQLVGATEQPLSCGRAAGPATRPGAHNGSGAQHVWFVVIVRGRRWDVASADRDCHGECSCQDERDAGAYRPGTPAAGVRRERRPAFMLGGAGHHAGRAVVLRCVCMVFVTGSDPSCPCPWGEGASGRSLPRRAGRCRDHGGEDPARDFRADADARRRAVSSCARPRTTGPWGWPLRGPRRAATAVRAPLPARPAPSRRRTAVPRPGCGG